MDKIARICQEIEKERKILETTRQGDGLTEYGCGRLDAFRLIDSIIDSLSEEKPNVWDRVDINKVIKARVKKTGEIIEGFYDGKGHFDHFIDHDVFDRYSIDDVEIPYEEFIAGLNPPPRISEMKMDVDLEKEIKSWIHTHVKGGDFEPYKTIKKAVIKWGEIVAQHFYELGRKQVLQEIYDGKTKSVDKITAAWLGD